MGFDQVGQNLPDMTEIGTAHQDLGSYCSSDWQADSQIACHCCLDFEISHLEETSCPSDLQSFIGTSWVLGAGLAGAVAASYRRASRVAIQAFGLQLQHQDGMQIA